MHAILVQPFNAPLTGRQPLPGSKSLTNRSLLLAALATEPVRLHGALFSRDTRIMADCLSVLGIGIQTAELDASITVVGCGGKLPVGKASLHVGNAGTAARFLTALVALHPCGEFHFDGDPAMRERPMQGLLQALQEQGCRFEFADRPWHFPFTLYSSGLRGGRQVVEAAASSQILSALLMVAPYARQDVTIVCSRVRPAFVNMTCALMEQWGVPCQLGHDEWSVPANASYRPAQPTLTVEADATAASYFQALVLAHGGQLALPGLHNGVLLQGDVAFADLLQTHYGLRIVRNPHCWLVQAGAPDLQLATPCRSSEPTAHAMGGFSDTFLTLAALAPLLPHPIRIHGIAHTRRQETDRIHAMATELRKLGQQVVEQDDSLTIFPDLSALRRMARDGVAIDTYEDHRVAMSFAILGTVDVLGNGQPWLTINDPLTCAKTYPAFFSALADISNVARRQGAHGFKVVAVDGGAASGKSSTSRCVAADCHFMHVDTGAHYRAVTASALQQGLKALDSAELIFFLNSLRFDTIVRGNSAFISLNGKIPDGAELRTAAVNANVSDFAALPAVRMAVKNYQRQQADVARAHGFAGLIMDGRDIGTVIFPDADLKVFLVADATTRAARRADEGQADSIANRDAIDSKRATAPLQAAGDAVVIDNSNMPLEAVVATIIRLLFENR